MKQIVWLGLIFITACNGRLTDEQRKRLHDGMKRNEIKKVSDAQLTDAAFALGRAISESLGSNTGKQRVDSLQRIYHVRIRPLYAKPLTTDPLEKQIVEAYIEGAGKVKLDDNIQKAGADTLFYTRPMVRERPDGSEEFNYAIGIRMCKRDIVNSIKE
jgi:hypothetical protein